MSISDDPFVIEMRRKSKDGEFLSAHIQRFEFDQPALTYSHTGFDGGWAVERAEVFFPALTITRTGNARLYEEVQRLWPTAIRPVGPFYTPPQPLASMQSLALPAVLLAASLLALVLLAAAWASRHR